MSDLTKTENSSNEVDNSLFGARKSISAKELYRLVGLKAGTKSEVSAKLYIDALVKVIADELMLCGKVRVPSLGVFTAAWRKGMRRKGFDFSTQTSRIIDYDPYIVVSFRPYTFFKKVINGVEDFTDNDDFAPYWNNLILEGRYHQKNGMDAAADACASGKPIEEVMSELKRNKKQVDRRVRKTNDTRKKSIIPKQGKRYVKGKIVKNNEL